MGCHGPDIKCPCRRCYACDGAGCEKCTDGIRCSKRGHETGSGEWTPGLQIRGGKSYTVSCKIDMDS